MTLLELIERIKELEAHINRINNHNPHTMFFKDFHNTQLDSSKKSLAFLYKLLNDVIEGN